MISNDNEPSTDTVITQSKATSSSNGNQPVVSPSALAVVSSSNATAEEQTVHKENNDQSNDTIDKDVQENRSVVVREDQVVEQEQEPEQGQGEDDEYIRITAAHQMLTEGMERERENDVKSPLTHSILCSSNLRRTNELSCCTSSLSYLCRSTSRRTDVHRRH